MTCGELQVRCRREVALHAYRYVIGRAVCAAARECRCIDGQVMCRANMPVPVRDCAGRRDRDIAVRAGQVANLAVAVVDDIGPHGYVRAADLATALPVLRVHERRRIDGNVAVTRHHAARVHGLAAAVHGRIARAEVADETVRVVDGCGLYCERACVARCTCAGLYLSVRVRQGSAARERQRRERADRPLSIVHVARNVCCDVPLRGEHAVRVIQAAGLRGELSCRDDATADVREGTRTTPRRKSRWGMARSNGQRARSSVENRAAVIDKRARGKRQVGAVSLECAAVGIVERAADVEAHRRQAVLRDRAAVVDEVCRVQRDLVCLDVAAAVVERRAGERRDTGRRDGAGVRQCRTCGQGDISVRCQRAAVEQGLHGRRNQVLDGGHRTCVSDLSSPYAHIAVAANGAASAVVQRAARGQCETVQVQRRNVTARVVERTGCD